MTHGFARATATLISLLGLTTASGADRTNVLFIAVDDMRVELGCYGGSPAITPNLDRLAEEGLRFHRAYCQQALCNPSRASLLTGRRPDTLKLWNLTREFRDELPNVVTLPEHFKHHGYFTQNIGKIFHNWRTQTHGDPQSWSVPAVMHYNTHGADTPEMKGDLPPDLAPHPRTEMRDVPDEAYFDGRIAKLSIEALRKIDSSGDPFFLAVGFWKPHLPFNPPKKYWDMYRRDEIELPANPDPPRGVPELALHDGRELLRSSDGKPPGADAIRELRHGYYAGISFLDAQIGKLLAELDRLDLRKSTLIVFWSDHGFHLGEHSLWCKTSNFELDARVPLIIAPPEYDRGGERTDALVELLDLYPTVVELCGLPQPEGLEGVSLAPLLDAPESTVKSVALTQHPRPAYYKDHPESMGYSLRTRRYRYTEWRNWTTGDVLARELYDHRRDPGESINLAVGNDHSDELSRLEKRLRREVPIEPHPEETP